MIVFLNGKFVPEEKALISVHDRGFLFGDGVWEALLVRRGRPFAWDEHMERLAGGIAFLKLTLPIAPKQMHRFALELIKRNGMADGMLRLSLSRGVTARGYSPRGAANPTLVMTLHPLPPSQGNQMPRWRVVTSSIRVPVDDPLTRFKTANKLAHVLARAEADAAGAQEALLLNTAGEIAEGTSSNVFWVTGEGLCTTPLPSGALPGVTRRTILELCVKRKIPCREKKAKPAALRQARGAFLTMTSMGVVEIESLDNHPLRRSPLAGELWTAYNEVLRKRTRSG